MFNVLYFEFKTNKDKNKLVVTVQSFYAWIYPKFKKVFNYLDKNVFVDLILNTFKNFFLF